ncbi:MAG: Stp1/IreP family PP2C-type Ser/Thr phosphatase [Myxococcota bacterium]
MSLRYALVSDTGRERECNEDAACAVEEIGLFVVADGMGGHVAGEVASRVAIESFVAFVKEHGSMGEAPEEARLLSEALLEANSAVQHEAASHQLYGMGTTLTAAQLRGHHATICHVGDSRAYLLHRGALEILTQDHTIVGLMVEEGVISADAARDHPERHMLTQAIGTQELVEPCVRQLELPRGSRLLLSTDGLHDVVSNAEILELGAGEDLDAAARSLVARANTHGGPDNITLILIEID